jgi:RNA polymerase sigma factor (sigma-70 family)
MTLTAQQEPAAPGARSPAPGPPDDAAVARRALAIARRTALGVLGDPEAAADVAQDVAITALERVGTLRDHARLDAWLHRIAVRTALREARRGRARRAAERARASDRAAGPMPSAASEVEGKLGSALGLLNGLPPRQRAAITLRYVHDLTDDEIGAALGCREATVRSLLSRGRAAVRAALDDRSTSRSDHADDH